MISIANAQTNENNIEYIVGSGNDTGLTDKSIDIVTASSSIHWMEPKTSINEIVRILKPDGLFTFYGYLWPPVSPSKELDKAYFEFKSKITALDNKLFKQVPLIKWDDIINYINTSKIFNYYRQFYLHQEINWTSDAYIGWLYSHGAVHVLLKNGYTESDLGLDLLIDNAKKIIIQEKTPFIFSYRVVVYKL